jgi:hypothetical protein
MTTWVVITEHPPQLCQTSNKVCGEMFAKLGPTLAQSDEIPGFKLVAGPLITSDHRSFLILEADDYELVRTFVVQSGSVQWNSVTTIPVINYEQALAELDVVEPLFMTADSAA